MNEVFPFVMPKLQPLPIKTKGLSWFKKLCVWATEKRQWLLLEDFYFQMADGSVLFIPKGFIFDGASIPKIFWWFLSPIGLLLIPSIFHDFGYSNQFLFIGNIINDYLHTEKVKVTRKEIDDLFVKIAYEVNEISLPDKIAWAMVRCFGWSAWNGHIKNKSEFINMQKEI